MIKPLDDFLNGTTMYRLMLYFLITLLTAAIAFSFFGVLPFDAATLLSSTAILIAACWITNKFLAKIFKVPTNLESVYITALILSLIITPINNFNDLPFILGAAVFAISSKFILAIRRKHIFNPAAFGVAASAMVLSNGASWWNGTAWIMPFVSLGGILIAKKVQRFSLVLSFLFTSLLIFLGASVFNGNDLILVFKGLILDAPLLFFAFVMLTEPQTTPPTKMKQIVYGSLVGLLFALPVRLGMFTITPEIALLAGNIFSYIVSPKEKLLLKLKEKIQIAPDIYDFVFGLEKKFNFLSGQYMEWTLGHSYPDNRGNRRYFTIAASPTENNLRIGVKFYPNPSSLKKTLLSLKRGSEIIAGGLVGEFTLPKDPGKGVCFIAGGIGITPFRSMIKYLLDISEKRDIILLYSNKSASDIVYKDIFDKASEKLGIRTVYTLTNKVNVPKSWKGRVGYIDANVIKEEVPDYKDRIFYLSGPHSMVDAFVDTLHAMGLPGNQIKLDFFPGYA